MGRPKKIKTYDEAYEAFCVVINRCNTLDGVAFFRALHDAIWDKLEYKVNLDLSVKPGEKE